MAHGSGHGHDHGTAAGQHTGRLTAVLVITVLVGVVEVVGGLVSGSLALLADAGHVGADAAGLAVSLAAVRLAQRPATARRTWGLARAEVIAAAVNATALGAVALWVLVEAAGRLADPPEVDAGPMLVVGLVGLAGNAVGVALLLSARASGLTLRGAFLEVLTDALASVGVVVAAVVLAVTGFARTDAVVAVLIALVVLPRAWRLLRASVEVLMEAVPAGVDLDELREHLLALDHVVGVHDVHASTVTSGLPVLTAHVVVEEHCFATGHAPALLDAVQECIAEHFDVQHSTVQLEPSGHAHHERGAHR